MPTEERKSRARELRDFHLRFQFLQEFAKFLESEVTRWAKVVKDNKITAQ